MSGTDAYEFIRICLSHRTEAARRDALKPLLESGIDWELVQREASRHRVLPVFFQVLENLLGKDLPASVREQSREHHRGLRIQNTFAIQELKRIAERFEDADLPVLALKGPVLSQTAYGDISLRRSVDTDIFVPKERFSEADCLLKEIGYEYADKRKGITGWRRKLSLYIDGQWQFTRGNSFALDVHTRLMPPGYSLPSDFHRFWKRARPVRLTDEIEVQGISAEDQVLVLVHHGIKNQWWALRHVVDLAAVIHEEDIDFGLLRSRAKEMEVTRALKLGLCMAHDVLEVSLPTSVKEWSLRDPIQGVAASMKSYLQNRSQKSALTYGERVQLQLATKDTFRSQLRYVAHSLLQHLWSEVLRPQNLSV